jgi:hypothetical protein
MSVWDKQHLIAYFANIFRIFATREGIDNRELAGFAPAE